MVVLIYHGKRFDLFDVLNGRVLIYHAKRFDLFDVLNGRVLIYHAKKFDLFDVLNGRVLIYHAKSVGFHRLTGSMYQWTPGPIVLNMSDVSLYKC